MRNPAEKHPEALAGLVAVQNSEQPLSHFIVEKAAAHSDKAAERSLKRDSFHHDRVRAFVKPVHDKCN